MSKNVVKREHFQYSRVADLKVNQRSFADKSGRKIEYKEVPYSYRYDCKGTDGEEFSFEDALYVQFGKLTSTKKGIELQEALGPDSADPSGKDRLTLRVDLVGRSGKEVEDFYNLMWDHALDWVVKNASELGTYGKSIKSKDVAKAVFAIPIYYREASKPPIKFFNFNTTNQGSKVLTEFKLPSAKRGERPRVIPHGVLIGKMFEFIPTVWFKRIYIGAKASLQSCLDSVIVTNIFMTVTSPVEDDTLSTLQNENPDLYRALNEQLDSWVGGGSAPLQVAAAAAPSTEEAETHQESAASSALERFLRGAVSAESEKRVPPETPAPPPSPVHNPVASLQNPVDLPAEEPNVSSSSPVEEQPRTLPFAFKRTGRKVLAD